MRINQFSRSQPSYRRLITFKKITNQDILYFYRQLTTLLKAGIPLVQSLNIITQSADKIAMQHLIRGIQSKVEAGHAFAKALSYYPHYFDSLFCSLIHTGEFSGALDSMLEHITALKEKSESLKRKIKKTFFYPFIVAIVAIIMATIILIWVIPQFEHIFKNFGVELPIYTQIVIQISRFIGHYYGEILGFLFLSLSLLAYTKTHFKKWQYWVDKWILKCPILGEILKKIIFARISHALSITFSSGIPLLQALRSVANLAGNQIYQQAIHQMAHEITNGSFIHIAMMKTEVFPNRMIQMVSVGEESGSLDHMLKKIADIYEEEANLAMETFSHLLEPLMMMLLGLLVGGLVIAMYLPIFKMGTLI